MRKTVTIVFCDVTGSTALGEQLDAESLRDVQSRYFDAMRVAIERHGGTVEKYIGDAVMAVFGIPQLHEDDAMRAVRAVIDMRQALAALNKELERDRGVTLQVRIGVNTGEVVTGDPATGQALVTGDAVNVAARLEQHAEPGEILLGRDTLWLVREAVVADPVAPLELKGKDGPVSAWSLVGVRERVSQSAPRQLDSAMVGRERQLSQLRQAFDSAIADTSCQLFTVLGSAGVGKSRLAEEFIDGVKDQATVLRGRCLPYGDGITYYPVVEAIKQAASLADFDMPEVVETRVGALLEGDEHQELVRRHVSQLMGVGEAAAGEETFWAIRRLFEAIAGNNPLVLAFDDIHWGESTFLDLVEHIAGWSHGSPILLLCMARADLLDVRPTWGGGKLNAATVLLEPLTQEQAERLVANLLGSAQLPPQLVEKIITKAEGNPLFVEETLGMLIDDGTIARDDNFWSVTGDLSAVSVPPSIQALLAARLDRLTVTERTVLEAAAVFGRDFFVGAVSDLVPEDARQRVETDLMALERKELIRPERTTLPGEVAFRFRHMLIRDSAYDAIAKSRRAELHERVADWLERVAGNAVFEQQEITGYHLEQAHAYRTQLGPTDERSREIGNRAAARLGSAGRRASARGDSAAAANLFKRAIAIGPKESDQALLFYDMADALALVGDAPASFAAFDESFNLAVASGDRPRALLAGIRRSEARMLVDPHGKSVVELRSELEMAAEELDKLGDESVLATVWISLAGIEWMPCRYEHAERAARKALEHARRSGDARLEYDALTMLLFAQMYGVVTPERGLRTLDELLEQTPLSPRLESFAQYVRGFYAGMEGSFDEARSLMSHSVEIAEGMGLPLVVSVIQEELGAVEYWAGDAVASERSYRRMYELLNELGDVGHRSFAAAGLARSLCALGRFDEAESYASEAMSVAATDDLISQVAGRSAMARVLAARGEFVNAEELAREANEMFGAAEDPVHQGDLRMDMAQILRMAGKTSLAKEAATDALKLFEGKGHLPLSEATRRFIADLSVST